MKENKVTIIVALIVLIAIPLTFYLVKQTQIFKSRAANSANVTFLNNNGNINLATNPPTVLNPANNVQMRLQFIPEPTSVPPTTAPTAVPTAGPPAQPAQPCVNEVNCVFGYVGTLNNTSQLTPLAGITVNLTNRPPQITTANGLFAFHGLPNGEYTLSVPDTLPTTLPAAFRSYTSLHLAGYIYNTTLNSPSLIPGGSIPHYTFTLNSSSVSTILAYFAYYDPNVAFTLPTGPPAVSPTASPAPTLTAYNIDVTLTNNGGVSLPSVPVTITYCGIYYNVRAYCPVVNPAPYTLYYPTYFSFSVPAGSYILEGTAINQGGWDCGTPNPVPVTVPPNNVSVTLALNCLRRPDE